MGDWPVGLSTGCFYQTSIFECLRSIRESGFDMLEICSFPAHLDYHNRDAVSRAAASIRELGLEAYSFHAPFAEHIDITAFHAETRHRAVHEILIAAEAAAELETRYFVIHPGPEESLRPPVEEHMKRLEFAAEGLNAVAGRCAELGISLVLENMLPHLLFGCTSDMLWLMGRLESEDVGACLDTGHAFLSGDLPDALRKLSGHLRMVHVNDNRQTYDDHLAPGQGKIDWRLLLNQLSSQHFSGGLILELHGNSGRESVLQQARDGRRFLRSLMRRLERPAKQRGPFEEVPVEVRLDRVPREE